jgi:competence protein ComEA
VKSGWLLAYGILIGLLVGGVLFLLSKPTRGEPVKLRPVPSPNPILVHISGEVAKPGIYSLPFQSRIKDVVESAGGLTELADDSKLNLAALLTDGQKISVPARPVQPDGRVGSIPEVLENVVFPIDLNTASQFELESLPEIGPKTALAILAYRDEHGPLKSVDELLNVPNIGPATLLKIQDFVTVNP